jgi:1-acyl-sn-glycerol-3-phosphate acyltransferase
VQQGKGSGADGVGMWLRSGLQTVLMVGSALLFGGLGFLTLPLPYRWRYRFITGWTRFNLWVLEAICGMRCEVQGLENIPAQAGVVMAKHQSAWETLALQRWFSPQTWVLKRELLWVPFWGWGMAALEPIAINRAAAGSAMRQVVSQGAKRLEQGRWLVIFPEGTRVAPGERGRYQPGGAVLAQKLGATVVPVAHNAGEFWRRKSFLKRPGTIQVRIGPPIATAGRSAKEILREVEEWIEARMQEISEAQPHDK